MNQEQNDLNPNNFNTQGNNGISNNQPLNNQSFNSKPQKKMNVGLIIGIVVAVGVGIVFGSKLLLNNGKDKNLNNLKGEAIKNTRNIELIGEYKNDSSKLFEEEPFLQYVNEHNNTIDILDKNGKLVFTMERSTGLDDLSYIGDGYFAYTGFGKDTFQIINIKGKKQTFNTEFKYTFYYENDILYYSYSNTTQAYDLKNENVLWEVEGGINPFLLENDKIILRKSRNDASKLIVDKKTGELLKTTDSEKTYATEKAYYLVNENSIDVYDYDNKKLSTFNLEENDEYALLLETLLNTGGFVIQKYNKKNYSSNKLYTIYNKNGKEIFSIETDRIRADSLYTYTYGGGIAKKQSNSKYSILKAEVWNYETKTYIIFEDDSYLELYDISICGKYAIGYVSRDDKRVKIINLETKEEKILSENLKNIFTSSINNTYFIIRADYSDKDNKYIVYDNNFNKIYSTNNTLKVINNDYFIEIDTSEQQQSKIYLLNKNTLDKKLLETNGVYDFNTSNNLVTCEYGGTKQWLYKFK